MDNSKENTLSASDIKEIDESQENPSSIFLNYYCPEEDGHHLDEYLYPRWRNAPRYPENFFESKSSISSMKDSDYERWLKDYYDEKLKSCGVVTLDKNVDTSDLKIEEEKPYDVVHSIFQNIRKDNWSDPTKYWGPQNCRRHSPLFNNSKECFYFPSIYPNLNLRSRYGRYHSQLYTAAAIPELTYKKLVCSMFKKNVGKLNVKRTMVEKIFYWDQIYNMKWFDHLTKSTIVKLLCKFFRNQIYLEKVCFENANLKKMDGIVLLCALSRSCGDYLKELHIWKMFDYGECPLLIKELPLNRKNYNKKSEEFFTNIHFMQVLYKFSRLTHLSVNYSYLANENGDAILSLKSIRAGCLEELRILCLKDERPLLTNPGYGVGGWKIKNDVWRRVVDICPNLRVKFVFLNMPQYENIIVFLSKDIPVSSVYISSGIDLKFQVPWEIDVTLLELRNWYANTLESLSLHLWHHRDLLDFVIKSKILQEFPNLLTFEFIGILENIETLEIFCSRLSNGNYKLKSLLFWVELQYTNKKIFKITKKRIEEIKNKYLDIFRNIQIDVDIQAYAL